MAAILADNIFKCIFLNESDKITIQISLKLVPRSSIDNKAALVQVMAWRRTGDKPLPGGRFKNTYELLNLRVLKFSYVNKIHIFQCMG